MAVSIITITNISPQVIPILVNEIAADRASAESDIPPITAEQMSIQPGAKVTIETIRVDLAQLEQLGRKRLLTVT